VKNATEKFRQADTLSRAGRWLMVLMVVGVAGCIDSESINYGVSTAPPPANEDSASFLDRVSSQDVVGMDDAMRGVLLLLDGEDNAKGFAERVQILTNRGIVDPKWHCSASLPIRRGKLAYMIYQACKMKGGVILLLTGPSQRYCLRELQYRGVMTEGAPYAKIGGMEYVAVLGRADVFIRTGEVPSTAGETSTEAEE